MEYKWTAVSVTTVGTLMAAIDSRILIIGLPTIAQQLHAGAAEVVWITQAYVLSSTICLLLVGRISDLFGRVRLYNIGFMIFTVGSALCALSLDSYVLIGFRIVQGVGAGILIANTVAIVTDASPTNELGKLLGVSQIGFRAGNVAGFTLSGVILSLVDWRGLFYVNIPIGIFGSIWARKKLREIATKDQSKKMDWTGIALFSSGLGLVLLAITYLSYGLTRYLEGFGLLGVGISLLIVFIRVESRTSDPMLDLRLFKIRSFAAGNLAQILNAMTWYGVILLVAFYLQVGLGYTPLQAGLAILPVEATYTVSAIVSGRLSDRYGSRGLTTVGILINALCCYIMSTFGASTQYLEVALLLAVMGAGNGMFTSPNTRGIMRSVPTNRIGIAGAFKETMFNVGSTVSYGLVILLVTFGIPYNAFSQLLQSAGPQSVILLERLEFLNGLRIAIFVLAILETIAIIPSAMRGQKEITLSKTIQQIKDDSS